MLGARHPQDQRDAVAGQQRARRPRDHPVAAVGEQRPRRPAVPTATRICAIDRSKPMLTWPRTWTVTSTPATCSRGSVRPGRPRAVASGGSPSAGAAAHGRVAADHPGPLTRSPRPFPRVCGRAAGPATLTPVPLAVRAGVAAADARRDGSHGDTTSGPDRGVRRRAGRARRRASLVGGDGRRASSHRRPRPRWSRALAAGGRVAAGIRFTDVTEEAGLGRPAQLDRADG